MSNWIAVEQRLPLPDEVVLVFGIDEHKPESSHATNPFHVWLGYRVIEPGKELKPTTIDAEFDYFKYVDGSDADNITHWMPLPEPPIE